MNQTPGLVGASLRGARWGLPWLSVLAISASVAYAVTVGVARAPSGPEASAQELVIAGAAGSVTVMAAVDRLGSGEACGMTGGRMLYVGLNSWVPAETRAARCPDIP